MSENLIYGADICAYGAVGDGKSDCTEALTKAIDNGENLISFPYGTYRITRDICLKSNTKLHLHKNARLVFESAVLSAKDCANIIICGGEIHAQLDFKNADSVKITGTSLFEKASFDGCENVKISSTTLLENSRLCICGKCEDFQIKHICLSSCKCLLEFSGATAEGFKCDGITGGFTDYFTRVCADSSLEDADFDGIDVYHIASCGNDVDSAYFSLSGSLSGIEIDNFKRNSEYESLPQVPSLFLSPKNDTAMILDGTGLDNVITARGASKTVSMTTARLTNPTCKFIYTLECSVTAGDAFTMPLGDFDFVSIYEK